MSYAGAAALQAAIFAYLGNVPGLATVPVFDAVPPANAPDTYVLIGPEDVVDASDKSGPGADHRLVISVVSIEAGFTPAKTVAAAISVALQDAALTLATGHLVGIWFVRAVARKLDSGAVRRVDLTFKARIDLA